MGNLRKYNAKRDFSKTLEPKGKKGKGIKKLRFSVQHHLARRDHYDLRLEWNGVLISFAVPKGMSFSPKDRRLAVKVEDHPLSYRKFEGVIPKGEYGGGVVMLFDYGYYEPLKDFKEGLKKGNIKFILKGKRLKGGWSLVRFQEDNWFLVKEKDEYQNTDDVNNYKTSVKTGRTMKEILENKRVSRPKTSRKEAIVCGIKITNPDKVIFKNPKVTKLDIAIYYHKIAPKMLPLMENRLISTIRMPDGEGGEKFFKKHFDANPYLGKVTIPSEKGHKEDYYYIKDEKGLIYEVQMNSFEFHIWGSKVASLNHPDLMVFDLDPDKKLGLKQIRDGVKDIKKCLDELNLKAFLKTSGGKGYHVIAKINTRMSWAKFKKTSEQIVKVLEAKYPDKYTTNIRLENREGKIFLDYLRNGKGATSVAPYSLRLKEKPSISMPISWAKLDKVKPDQFVIADFLKKD